LTQWDLDMDEITHLYFDLHLLVTEKYYLFKHVDPIIRDHHGLDEYATLLSPDELRESIRIRKALGIALQ
jgi:hypothetical protein